MEIGASLQRLSSWFKPPENHFQEVYKNDNVQGKDKAALQGLFKVEPHPDDHFFDFEFLNELVISNSNLEDLLNTKEQSFKDETQATMTYQGANVNYNFGYQLDFGITLNTLQNLFTLAVKNDKIPNTNGSITLDKIDSKLSKNVVLGWKIHQPDTPQQKAHIALKNKTNNDCLTITLKSDDNSKKENIGQVLAAMTDLEKPSYSLESAAKYSEGHEWQMDGEGNLFRDGLGFIRQVDTGITVEKSDQNGFEDLPPSDDFDPADWWKNL